MKLAQIASALGASLENGSSDIEITGVAGIEEAGTGDLTFVANPKYAAAAHSTKALTTRRVRENEMGNGYAKNFGHE